MKAGAGDLQDALQFYFTRVWRRRAVTSR